jgi:hypothetical protein
MRVVAVDWSGRSRGAAESIWRAEVRDGLLRELCNGYEREELIEEIAGGAAGDGSELVVGLDFAFSFPRWWCEERGWRGPGEVWAAIAEEGEDLLAACEPPFWGQTGKRQPGQVEGLLRRTERDTRARGAKSIFQIGGAGAVGVGSIRGMRHLLTLREAGFAIWPFDSHFPRVFEIYPRALTGAVRKSRWRERHDYLLKSYGDQPHELLERAAGSEDAFDATVSALVMAAHESRLRDPIAPDDSDYLIEGEIWHPAKSSA